jgi:hypothetical protein
MRSTVGLGWFPSPKRNRFVDVLFIGRDRGLQVIHKALAARLVKGLVERGLEILLQMLVARANDRSTTSTERPNCTAWSCKVPKVAVNCCIAVAKGPVFLPACPIAASIALKSSCAASFNLS